MQCGIKTNVISRNISAHYVTVMIAIIGAFSAGYCFIRYKKNKLPTSWTLVGTLTNLYIFPIKSCAPQKVDSAVCTYLGLKHGWLRDRVLMVVDENNNFVSARAYPKLLLVKPSVRSSTIILHHVDMDTLYINLAQVVEEGNSFNATIWGCNVPVFDCSPEANQWFTKLLNTAKISFRLVYYTSQKCRVLKTIHNTHFYNFRDTDTGAFVDDTSYNLVNNASIGELNSRLTDVQVDHRYFRPNITVEGAKAFDEDRWKCVKIGENVFEVIKPCIRCDLTTIDPDTGTKNTTLEPLKTLRSYRQFEDPVERKLSGNSPRFGLLIALRSEPGSPITLHDNVYVSYK